MRSSIISLIYCRNYLSKSLNIRTWRAEYINQIKQRTTVNWITNVCHNPHIQVSYVSIVMGRYWLRYIYIYIYPRRFIQPKHVELAIFGGEPSFMRTSTTCVFVTPYCKTEYDYICFPIPYVFMVRRLWFLIWFSFFLSHNTQKGEIVLSCVYRITNKINKRIKKIKNWIKD